MARVTINLSDEVAEELNKLASEKGKSLTAFVRDALSTELYLQSAIKKGDKVLLESEQGRVRELAFR
jgi:predicted transcriptional regulator